MTKGIDCTDEDIVINLWHWMVEDGITSWVFAAAMLRQNGYKRMSGKTVKERFKKYFEDTTGESVYVKCPACEKGTLVPRSSDYGYFVGCSEYPRCKYHAYQKR